MLAPSAQRRSPNGLISRTPARRFAAAAALLAILTAGQVARAEDQGDGDDVLWAGDDAWSDPASATPSRAAQPVEVATVSSSPGGGPRGAPAVQAGTATVDVGDGYPGTADGMAGGGEVHADIETTAPRYQDFQENLSPYGDWTETEEYGRVWRPTQVDASWRPYLDGRWVYTSRGWTWVAEEPFGWATYHYGRWWHSPRMGWSWVPGRVWAPAWVTWRTGGGNSGWAPMGPGGIVYVERSRWVFVQNNHFTQPIRTYAIPAHKTNAVWNQVALLPIRRPGPMAGPQVSAISRAVGQPIRAVPVSVANNRNSATRPAQVGGTLSVFKPAGVPFRHVAAVANAARTRPDWQQRGVPSSSPRTGRSLAPVTGPSLPAGPRAGFASVGAPAATQSQRAAQPAAGPTGKRWTSGAPRDATPRPKWGAAVVDRPAARLGSAPAQPNARLRFGGVPSQGIIDRNRRGAEQTNRAAAQARPSWQQPSRNTASSPSRPSPGASRPSSSYSRPSPSSSRPSPSSSRPSPSSSRPSSSYSRPSPSSSRPSSSYSRPSRSSSSSSSSGASRSSSSPAKSYSPPAKSYSPPAKSYSPPRKK